MGFCGQALACTAGSALRRADPDSGKTMRRTTNAVKSGDACCFYFSACLGNQIIDECIEHTLQRFVEDQLRWSVRILGLHGHEELLEDAHVPANVIEIEYLGFHAVIEVSGEIGDLVGEIDDLRLERRPLVEKVLAQLRMFSSGIIARVLDDAFAHGQS